MVSRGLFFISFIFTSISSYSQESRIIHYQKKCELQTLVMPCSDYNSNMYTISFPDSIYTGGQITIKKLKREGEKFKAQFYFSENQYTKAVYTIRKSKLEKFKLNINYSQYLITEEKIGKKVRITISCKL